MRLRCSIGCFSFFGGGSGGGGGRGGGGGGDGRHFEGDLILCRGMSFVMSCPVLLVLTSLPDKFLTISGVVVRRDGTSGIMTVGLGSQIYRNKSIYLI